MTGFRVSHCEAWCEQAYLNSVRTDGRQSQRVELSIYIIIGRTKRYDRRGNFRAHHSKPNMAWEVPHSATGFEQQRSTRSTHASSPIRRRVVIGGCPSNSSFTSDSISPSVEYRILWSGWPSWLVSVPAGMRSKRKLLSTGFRTIRTSRDPTYAGRDPTMSTLSADASYICTCIKVLSMAYHQQ